MEKYEICFIESGVGGVSVLRECVRLVRNFNFLYIADNRNSPYGNKNQDDLNEVLYNLIGCIHEKFGIRYFVLACNTATAMSIKMLRLAYPDLTFVGIEPAIKPCVIKGGRTLVLSTLGTYRYSDLIAKYLDDEDIIFSPQKDLAMMIDSNLDNLWNIYDYLRTIFMRYQDKKVDNIVLGCTHYFFIREQLGRIFPEAIFFESNDGVAERLKNLLDDEYKLHNKKGGRILFLTTKKDLNFERRLYEVYNRLK